MACNSIATTRATIGNIVLNKESLAGIIAAITGRPIADISTNQYSAQECAAYIHINGITYEIESYRGSVELSINAATSGESDRLMQKHKETFDRALIIAQQKTVIAKLAALGKLSQVQGKDNGVTLRLEIDVK